MYIQKCLASLFAIEQTMTACFGPTVIMYFTRLDFILIIIWTLTHNSIALAWLLVNIYHDVITKLSETREIAITANNDSNHLFKKIKFLMLLVMLVGFVYCVQLFTCKWSQFYFKGVLHPWALFLKTLCIFSKN